MVLGYGGFLGLSTYDYRQELKTKTNKDLQTQEIVKLRRMFTCAYIAAGGLGGAAFTFGGSLIAVGISGRRWRVADRKLGLIREELTRRGIPHHKLKTKDVLIPAVSCLIGGAVAHGIDFGLGELVDVGNAQIDGPIRESESLNLTPLDEVFAGVEQPGAAAAGLLNGFLHQGHVISDGGVQIHEAINNTASLAPSPDATAASIIIDPEQLCQTIALATGTEMGQAPALQSEDLAGYSLAWTAATYAMEAFENPDHYRKAVKHLGCRRFYGLKPNHLSCDGCKQAIPSGQYMREHHHNYSPDPQTIRGLHYSDFGCHSANTVFLLDCCQCESDNYDLCLSCYNGGKRCRCGRANAIGLHKLQVAIQGNADFVQCRGTIRDRQSYSSKDCDGCKARISQGRYYRKCIGVFQNLLLLAPRNAFITLRN